jgi:hypothetical protein
MKPLSRKYDMKYDSIDFGELQAAIWEPAQKLPAHAPELGSLPWFPEEAF